MTDKKIKFSKRLHAKTLDKKIKSKNSSNRWFTRHINDPYVDLSRKEGYRSRAAFKLIEINNQFKVFKPGHKVLDLGASPGSWSQIAEKYTTTKKNIDNIVALDLLDMKPMSNVQFIQGDIYDESIIEKIKNYFPCYDVIMSDIAPNTVGQRNIDHLRIMDIVERIEHISHEILATGGNFIIKIFQGGDESIFINQLRKNFATVKRFKPDSSRKESPEIYIVAMNYSGFIPTTN